jgi:xylose isomerase
MLRNSVGIWAFGPSATRFVPAGYHPEVSGESMVEKTRRVAREDVNPQRSKYG